MPDLDIIGTLYTQAEGSAVELPGWHVNATARIAEFAAYEVAPATPRRVFAGVQTVCYAFASHEQFEQLLAGVDLSNAPPPTVRSVAMRQACLWLSRAGMLETVEALVAASPDSELGIWWRRSSEVHIDAPPLRTLLPQLGITPEQLPAIFEAANQL